MPSFNTYVHGEEIKIMSNVRPFSRSLLRTIRKRFAQAPVLDKKGKQVREDVLDVNGNPVTYTAKDGSTKTRRRVKKKDFKEVDYIFRVYTHLIGLDEYLTIKYEKSLKKKRKEGEFDLDLDLVSMFDRGISFLKRRFKRKGLPNDFRVVASRISSQLNDLEKELNEKKSFKQVISYAKRTARSSNYRVRNLERFSELVQICFEVMDFNVTTRKKSNPNLSLPYLQFDIEKSVSRQISQLEDSDIEKYQITREMLKQQEEDLERSLRRDGLDVQTRRVFVDGEQALIKIAYRKECSDIEEMEEPTLFIPEGSSEFEIELYQAIYEGEKAEYEDYLRKKDCLVQGVYSSSFLEHDELTGTRSYKIFESVEELKESLKLKAQKEKIQTNLFPDISLANKEMGTYNIFFPASKGRSGGYHLKRYDEASFLEEEDRTREISDGDGRTKGIRRVLSVRKAFIDGRSDPVDVITAGKYKGFLFEDIVNINGRLIEGSFNVKVGGQTFERDLIEDGELKFAFKDLEGQISSRLLEPYITLSEDKTRLCIGIPSSQPSKLDRDAMLQLSKEIATIEPKMQFPLSERLLNTPTKELNPDEKKIRRQHLKANTLNPFYYFRAEDYEVVRDTLGSVAISKPASDFLDRYFDQLTKRERSLNEENLRNYTERAIGGFIEEINGKPFKLNNKQVEAMAWLDANDFSGVMALDTGVGKTLLSVGAIRKAMASEEGGEKRRFLFVSPSRLNGNIEKEISRFITEGNKKETLSRLDEMDYKRFSDLFAEKGTEYFKSEYYACFFDEVNEIFSKSKFFKALSGLKHPRKILLTASSIEQDPVDLYKFVSVAQGVEYDKKGENAWAKRYTTEIGGRRIGLTSDPRVRQEFFTWVKANAYFAFKEEVNFKEIGQPVLCKPNTKSVSIKMRPAVRKEYAKLARELSRELEGMLKKYRDGVEEMEEFEYTEEVVRRGKKKEVIRTLKDFAKVSIPPTFKKLLLLATDPEEILGEKAGKNPKLQESSKILKRDPNDRIVFFCSNTKLAKKACMNNASTRPSSVHGLLTPTSVSFYQAGKKGVKKIASITKKTDLSSEKWMQQQERIMRTASEEDATWAIKACERFIKENQYVSTIVCTDAYAKGFNFQTFQKVVHLDRGKGFDSELLKQRTARVYRTGQKGVVDEIYLDASLTGEDSIQGLEAGEITVQEMQRLLNCRDQKFFMEIIQKGMAQSLTESLDKVESTTGLDIAREKDPNLDQTYLAQLLDPTDEAIANYRKMKEMEEDNPLLHLAELSPSRFDGVGFTLKKRFRDLRGQPLGTEDKFYNDISEIEDREVRRSVRKLFDVSGVSTLVTDDAKIDLGLYVVQEGEGERSVGKDTGIVRGYIDISSPRLSSARSIDFIENTVFNAGFRSVGDCSPKQLGSRSVFTQALSAQRNNIESISMEAVAGDGFTGTQVWAKMGFDGEYKDFFKDISQYLEADKDGEIVTVIFEGKNYLQKHFKGSSALFTYFYKTKDVFRRVIDLLTDKTDFLSEDEHISEMTEEDYLFIAQYSISQKDSVMVSDILSAVDESGNNIGVKWWDSYGPEHIKYKFDTSPKSLSMRVLKEYFKKKCIERDIDPIDYLQEPLPLFNVYDESCWAQNLYTLSKDGYMDMIRKYPKEFKMFYYSLDDTNPIYQILGDDFVGDAKIVRTASSKEVSDDKIFSSVWGAIGNERISRSNAVSLLRTKNPEKLMELTQLENEED